MTTFSPSSVLCLVASNVSLFLGVLHKQCTVMIYLTLPQAGVADHQNVGISSDGYVVLIMRKKKLALISRSTTCVFLADDRSFQALL